MRPLFAALCFAVPVSLTFRSPAVPIPYSRFPIPDTLGDRLRRELGPWLDERAKTGAFSGVVLVAKNGTPDLLGGLRDGRPHPQGA